MNKLPYEITKIINVANELATHGSTGASTSEQIAAAFVLNQLGYLPIQYDNAIDAWNRLDDWQQYVHTIREHYMHLIKAG